MQFFEKLIAIFLFYGTFSRKDKLIVLIILFEQRRRVQLIRAVR